MQSVMSPAGPAAAAIAKISWVMFIGGTLILLLVMALALYAVLRAPRQRARTSSPLNSSPRTSSHLLIVAGGVALPVLTLTALLVYGFVEMRQLRGADPNAPIDIVVVGNQWWWDVHYPGAPGLAVTTANEIHIPTGVPVRIAVRTNDVIHSFWVPRLAGKIDLIPGRTNHIVLRADEAGIFRGQCAEFCGAQHARMALLVIAEPAVRHQAWLASQRRPAAHPADARALRGRREFTARGCVDCHAVRGLGAAPLARGPDLTHIGSRLQLGAGTLANNRANLVALIAHGQRLKPGNRMPAYAHLEPDALEAIAVYLEGLK
ncbi:cytochrome c oxidase subunit II [Massilia glaciei]|uniref:cytochrome c oxidase subunit II n=1 Tax=Massilia glaciei TaxID=1524097 RepID=UPI001C62FFDF|nr:cytochrome c oxidase subunit II [Massilia glaciei]